MKHLDGAIGLAVIALIAVLVVVSAMAQSSVTARPVRLVVTGPNGQRFSGRYTADGVTNSISAVAPATVNLRGSEVSYEFRRDGGDGEFRVAVYVAQRCRTSTTSDKKQGVRGQIRYTSSGDSCWAAGY